MGGFFLVIITIMLLLISYSMKNIKRFSFVFFLTLANCSSDSSSSLSPEEKQKYLQEGKAIAQASFGALSQELKTALKQGGVPHAVKYCNLQALSIMDSLSQAHQVVIKRVSRKPRNPVDAPDPLETEILEAYQQTIESGKEPKPRLAVIEGNGLQAKQIQFNAPILVKPLCLNCHGKVGEQIKEKDYQLVKQLYPQDQAINYQVGDLRGMWSIRFYDLK